MEEILDQVDVNDNVIGTVEKRFAKVKGVIHRIVHIIIFDKKGKIALQKRSKEVSYMPGAWVTTAGGHVISGETYLQGANRELFEELGIKLELEKLFYDFYETDRVTEFLTTFKAVYEGEFNLNPKEAEWVEYFTLEEIQKMINNGELFHTELLFLLKKHFNVS